MRLPLILMLLLFLTGCFPRNTQLEPQIHYAPQVRDICQLSSPFSPLTPDERQEEWGREFVIGRAFARELDLYRAITSYKRALVLLPVERGQRRQEIEYCMVLCYFLGDRFSDTIRAVESTTVAYVTPEFPAYRDLLLILYESYLKTGQSAQAGLIWRKLQQVEPDSAEQVIGSAALRYGDLPYLNQVSHVEGVGRLMTQYGQQCKSVGKAQVLNAILPGAGYFYLGQRQSAITAALLNGIFIFGTYQLMARGLWPFGIFTGSLEIGWYVGGIYGAGQAAHFYNERLYERLTAPQLCQRRLFPVMMLRFAF